MLTLKQKIMAKNARNIVTHGLSGKLGDLIVFRQRGDETIVSAKPRKRVSEPSQAEIEHRQHFMEATIYARAAKADPAQNEAYLPAAEKEGLSVYNVAVADFLKAPLIDEIDITGYTGESGSTIRIRAVDDFKVTEVTVVIRSSDGTELESGVAIVDPNGLDWVYTATTANTSPQGTTITVVVSDVPGNVTQQQKSV
jgi:hypothetical protein